MKNTEFKNLFNQVEAIRSEIEGVEFWSARDLQKIFDYTQ